MSAFRRVVLVVGVLAVVGLIIAVWTGDSGEQTAGSATGTATPAPPAASTAPVDAGADPVAASSAPGTDQLEPGPDVVVPTDEPVPAGQLSVVLSYLDWNDDVPGAEASGYVSGVVENGGSCTLTLTRNGQRVTVEGDAEADASTTVCGGLTVPRTSLTPGSWSGVLTYESAGSSGESAAVTLEVPAS
jgi:hypothetical protein